MKPVVLFDLDGTLIDTWRLYVQAMERTIKEIGHDKIPVDRLASLRLNSEPCLLGYFVPPDEVESAHQRFLANYHSLHGTCFGGVYPGVPKLLSTLRGRDIKTGIITGKSRGAWDITRRHVRLGEFDVMVFDDDVSEPKPDCEGLLKAVSDLDASPDETVYVGDSVDDLKAAKAAGIGFLAALWSKTDPEIRSFKSAAEKVGAYTCMEQPLDVDRFLQDSLNGLQGSSLAS